MPPKRPPSPKIQHPKGPTCSNIAISNGRSRLHGLVQHWMGSHLQHHQLSEHLPGALQRRCQVHRAAQPVLPVLRWQLLQACAGHCADERNRSAATQRKVTRHGQLTGLELRSEIGDVTHHKLRIDKPWSNRPQKCKKFARRSSSLALSSQ